jgi:hypothetical protein
MSAQEVEDVCLRIRPHLAGRGAEVQGAVLARLVAVWILGHVALDPGEQASVHADMLEVMVDTIRELIR